MTFVVVLAAVVQSELQCIYCQITEVFEAQISGCIVAACAMLAVMFCLVVINLLLQWSF